MTGLPLSEWIVAGGLLAVFLLMFGETLFPPMPSEIIMPLAGFQAAQGRMDLAAVILAGAAGAMLGNTMWYGAARALGEERFAAFVSRHARWTTIDAHDVAAARRWFDRHGAKAVGLGRMIPTVRSLISVPAGLARMRFWPFAIFSSLGTLGWTAALAGAGWMLGARFEEVEHWLNPVSTAVIAVILATYAWRLLTWKQRAG
jgi:membrane protein DedA with SNARE-associated domain